jgi:hypothetical protein
VAFHFPKEGPAEFFDSFKNENSISILFIHYMLYTNSFVNVFQFGFDSLWVSSGEFIHDIFQSKVPISVFDEVNTIEKLNKTVDNKFILLYYLIINTLFTYLFTI